MTPASEKPQNPDRAESTDVVRERVIRLAFGGDRARYDAFVHTLHESIPPDVSVILRGSAVTGTKWGTSEPFDAEGPGTSDLDLTLIGGDMVKHFDAFYIPRLHSVPLSDEHPDASATFIPLRNALTKLAGRPVNIQATADAVQYLRDVVMSQPHFTLIERDEEPDGKKGDQ
jgi:hypothetical protein